MEYKQIAICGLLVVVGCSQGAVPPEESVETTPHQSVDKANVEISDVNLGIADPHSEIEGTVPIVNRSDGPIVVEGVQVSCGCVRVTDAPKEIAANSTGYVKFKIKTGNRPAGPLQQSVSVKLAGIQQWLRSRILVGIRGFWFDPRQLDIGSVSGAAVHARRIRFNSIGHDDVVFESVQTNHPAFEASLVSEPMTRRLPSFEEDIEQTVAVTSQEVLLSPIGIVPAGPFQAVVDIAVNVESDVPTLTVRGTSLGEITCSPPVILISRSSTIQKATVTLADSVVIDDSPVRFETTIPGIQCEVTQQDERKFQVQLEWKVSPDDGKTEEPAGRVETGTLNCNVGSKTVGRIKLVAQAD